MVVLFVNIIIMLGKMLSVKNNLCSSVDDKITKSNLKLNSNNNQTNIKR